MNFQELLLSDIRALILRALAQDADYAHNEYVLKQMLSQLGHKISTDKLRTELYWLREQGLIDLADVSGTIVAKLTPRGKDVAEGATVVPGVHRPEPTA